MREQTIATTTHGRFLVEPARARAAGILVGFHGYGEPAELQMDRLRSIPGSDGWLLVAVQGLHRFYRGRTEDVVASWMTRQDRELAIADNVAFVASVVEAVVRESRTSSPMVFSGFSQGVAMAFRAACASSRPVAGVIAAGGDVPPELGKDVLGCIPAVVLARGARDEWYPPAKWAYDQSRLREARVHVRELDFEGAHEWNADVSRAAGEFLQRLTPSSR
jgi:predicted esterase